MRPGCLNKPSQLVSETGYPVSETKIKPIKLLQKLTEQMKIADLNDICQQRPFKESRLKRLRNLKSMRRLKFCLVLWRAEIIIR